jgi:hypothetical protein
MKLSLFMHAEKKKELSNALNLVIRDNFTSILVN